MAEGPQGITAITVGGYKSIRDETTIEIRPLTILAGANSSGKSSIMQPMLLMKQTLDAIHDPGLLLIDGPNLTFSRYEQFVPRILNHKQHEFTAGYRFDLGSELICKYTFPEKEAGGDLEEIELIGMRVYDSNLHESFEITPEMSDLRIDPLVPDAIVKAVERAKMVLDPERWFDWRWSVSSSRCFLHVEVFESEIEFPVVEEIHLQPLLKVQHLIENVMHVSGSRAVFERISQATSTEGPKFPGQFHNYIAGLILRWQDDGSKHIQQLEKYLQDLNLTKWVEATRVDVIGIKLNVGRLPVSASSKSREDKVSIADVGSSFSLVLPVLVALIVAERGQVVYIEQPESDLHPSAQVAMASILADAAKRGVRVVVETHSSLLLQGILTLIAQDKLDHEDVMLHWFTRDEEGFTRVDSVEPDRKGTYGDWPEDFADVELGIQRQYLDAVAEREFAT